MGTTPPPGYGIARLIFSVAGRPDQMNVTFGIQVGGGGPQAAATAILGYWTGLERPFNPAAIAAGYTFEGVEVTAISETGPIIGADLSAVVGVGAFAPPPPAVCLLMTKQTARGGRKGRGRVFWPPFLLDESQVSVAGNIDISWISAHQTLFQASVADWIAGDHPPVLLHEDGTAPNPLTGVSLQGTLATQRRRQR